MSVTGICLILFLTFHMSMNVVALFSASGYNMICEFLGANWYAVVATLGLAALAVIHILYAFWLTLQNRKARGANKYAMTATPEKVEWASQNMLVLGLIIVIGLLLHLYNFWWNMMATELIEGEMAVFGDMTNPGTTDGYGWILKTFHNPFHTIVYLVWLVAIWFHLTHGFWSALQTLGWNGKTWFCRWKVIGQIYTTLLMLGFAVVAIVFTLK